MKKKKKFKGMTLMEIIISLAVLAVLTLVLVQTSSTINMYIKSANNVNKKTVQQAPVAEIGHKDAGNLVQGDMQIIVSGNGVYGSGVAGTPFSQELKGNAYEAATDTTENVLGGNLNMQYIVDVEAVTTEPPVVPGT